MWLTAAVLCSVPAPPRAGTGDWRWAPGGPVHPVHPWISARSFPCAVPVGVHVRVSWSGEGDAQGQIAVSVVDGAGAPLRWGAGLAPATRHISFTRPARLAALLETPPVGEWAETATLSGVTFPAPGRYGVLARLTGGRTGGTHLSTIWLPLTVAELPSRPGTATMSRNHLRSVMAELGGRLAPSAHRVLRLAAREARRLHYGSVGTQHLLIALRRVLGTPSGLPATALLREAAEQLDGLGMLPVSRGPSHLTPSAAAAVRQAAAPAVGGIVDAAALLHTLLDGTRGSHGPVLEEARLLATRPPR